MKKRRVELSGFIMSAHNGFDNGFIVKRNVTCRESRHILRDFLGIDISNLEDCGDMGEYKEYNEELTRNVNLWLKGEADDTIIMEYAYGCETDPIGIWNAFKIAEYLISRKII